MIRLHLDLSDGLRRTYDVTRYVVDHGVLRLYAPAPAEQVEGGEIEGGEREGREREGREREGREREEVEVAAFAAGGWLRFERDLPFPQE